MAGTDDELAELGRRAEEAKGGPEKGGREVAASGGPREVVKSEVFGWAMFDFANSSFTTVIVTVVFPVYFAKAVVPESFTLLGRAFTAADGPLLYSLAGAASLLMVLLTSPLFGALADFSAAKKKFLLLSYLGCVLFTGLLYMVGPGDVALAMLLFIAAKFCFSTGENFVSSFLPDIAPPEQMGKVSGFAWALGFFGGIACLLLCEPWVGGMGDPAAAGTTRTAFLVVAGFFLLAGIPTFLLVPERGTANVLPPGETYTSIGIGRLKETLQHVSGLKELVKFLGVFSLYNAGLSVVVYFTALYAESELGFTAADQMKFFVIINVVAALGAAGFGVVQDRIGAKKAINLTLVVWMVAIVAAYKATTKDAFWIVGYLAGSALGATQSGSRALVGAFSPPSRSAEFFGFWGLFWKLSEAIGPLVFGVVSSRAGLRTGILFTLAFFVAGFLGMLTIDEKKGMAEAADYEDLTRREEAEMAEATQIARTR